MKSKIKLILVEDNEQERNIFENTINQRNDILLSASTNSSNEALDFVKNFLPDAIILDLELHDGTGSGFDFLSNLESLKLKYTPLIAVTTNISSNIIYDKLHKDFSALVFYKKQIDYSPKLILDNIALLCEKPNDYTKKSMTSFEEKDTVIRDEINKKLDLIGISYKLKGRDYIFDGIYYSLTTPNTNNISVFEYLSNRYNISTKGVYRAMETAINRAWNTSALEDLRLHYTAPINFHTCVPTPSEFISYYVTKLKN